MSWSRVPWGALWAAQTLAEPASLGEREVDGEAEGVQGEHHAHEGG